MRNTFYKVMFCCAGIGLDFEVKEKFKTKKEAQDKINELRQNTQIYCTKIMEEKEK